MTTAGVELQNATRSEILKAIHGHIEPVRTSPMYVAGMTLVAFVMVILPLVYLSLIVLVAALLWYHATHSISIFEHARGRNAKGAFAIYVGPLVMGGIVLLFMVKPLFAPRRRGTDPLTLDPADEPLLFAFVKKLCAAVHAPAPREIRVDSEVNASAALRRGFWSMFGSDLTLTIGLPLAAGMSLRQLAGVLAHEFGHFSQGAGMRLTYVIRSIIPQITPEIRKQVLEPLETAKSGFFDTHPADRDRVASARLEKTPGIFRLPVSGNAATHPDSERRNTSAAAVANSESEHFDDGPDALRATVLFSNFKKLARDVTLVFYEEQLERKVLPEEVYAVESLVGSQEVDLQAGKTLQRYFQGTASPLRPCCLPPDLVIAPSNAEEAKQTVIGARDRMLNLLVAYRTSFKEFDDADTDHLAATIAEAVYRAKAGSHRKQLQLKYDDAESAATAAERASSTIEAAHPRLAEFETAAAERLSAAVQLVHLPDLRVQAQLEDDVPGRVARLLKSAQLAASVCPDVVKLRNLLAVLSSLLHCVGENENNTSLISAIRLCAATIRERLVALRGRLAGNPYPFDHAQADMTLDRYVFGLPAEADIPDADEISQIGSLANDTVNKVFSLHQRSLSHLSVAAEKIELALGLAPLPELPPVHSASS